MSSPLHWEDTDQWKKRELFVSFVLRHLGKESAQRWTDYRLSDLKLRKDICLVFRKRHLPVSNRTASKKFYEWIQDPSHWSSDSGPKKIIQNKEDESGSNDEDIGNATTGVTLWISEDDSADKHKDAQANEVAAGDKPSPRKRRRASEQVQHAAKRTQRRVNRGARRNGAGSAVQPFSSRNVDSGRKLFKKQ